MNILIKVEYFNIIQTYVSQYMSLGSTIKGFSILSGEVPLDFVDSFVLEF